MAKTAARSTGAKTKGPAVVSKSTAAEHVDVLIVGAGISGIGAAYHLLQHMPGTSFVALETQASFGGTWRTHRYPGIRSDSDLFTFGYSFKPWTGPPIATAEEILCYLGEVIDENDLGRFIRYRHKITHCGWSSKTKRWAVRATDLEAGTEKTFTCGFLWMCQGYYRHDQGYTPEWPDMGRFKGRIVHPQTWPDDLTLKDKRVVVIGSGATAATLIPNIADACAHVTMLQRSPTFFITGRNAIEIADQLRKLNIDPAWIHEIVRRQISLDRAAFAERARAEPEAVTAELLAGVRNVLGEDYDIATHFTPRYRPWRQRIAFVPEADFFKAIRDGKASVVTDEIARFTEAGIALKSGAELKADVIVTATGFHMQVMGDVGLEIDGTPHDIADSVTYRGMMFTGIPNMAWIFGYLRASWTLRVDLVADFVIRLLKHMRVEGHGQVMPALRPEDHAMSLGPWIDHDNFNAGYVLRGQHLMPRAGDKREWQHTQDYWGEKDEFPAIDLDDKIFQYR